MPRYLSVEGHDLRLRADEIEPARLASGPVQMALRFRLIVVHLRELVEQAARRHRFDTKGDRALGGPFRLGEAAGAAEGVREIGTGTGARDSAARPPGPRRWPGRIHRGEGAVARARWLADSRADTSASRLRALRAS